MKKYTCHSGGAEGADITWENECAKYGIDTIAYSFGSHNQQGKTRKILSSSELNEGSTRVDKANISLKRYLGNCSPYVRNLLNRNWFQVKNSNQIFAVASIEKNKKHVSGGTGWAVQMAIDFPKSVYVFDQDGNCKWNVFDYEKNEFVEFDGIPTINDDFAGIGSRDLTEEGRKAIEEMCKHNFSL